MIQDIAPHTYHNEYRPSQPDKDSFILVYEKGSILLPRQEREEAISFPRFQELEGKTENLYSNYIYLFSVDDQRFYLIPHLDASLLPDYGFQCAAHCTPPAPGIRRNYRPSALPPVQ